MKENAQPLYRACRGLGFRQDEAEDLVQEVFVTFMETLDRFEGRSRIQTWLFGILHRKVMERRRVNHREDLKDPIDDIFESRFGADGSWTRPPADLDRLVASEEIGIAIGGCMETLPSTQREVFVLREIEGMTTAEICNVLGVTITNFGVLMHRARNRLRECLESQGWDKTS